MGKRKDSRSLQVKVFEARKLRLSCLSGISSPPSVVTTITRGSRHFKTAPCIPVWKGETHGWCISCNEEGEFESSDGNKVLKITLHEILRNQRPVKVGEMKLRLDPLSIKTYPTTASVAFLTGQWYDLESATEVNSALPKSSPNSSTTTGDSHGEILLLVNWLGVPPAPTGSFENLTITPDDDPSSVESRRKRNSSSSAFSVDKDRKGVLGIFSRKAKKDEPHTNEMATIQPDGSIFPQNANDTSFNHDKTNANDRSSLKPAVQVVAAPVISAGAIIPLSSNNHGDSDHSTLQPLQNNEQSPFISSDDEFLPWQKSKDGSSSTDTNKLEQSATEIPQNANMTDVSRTSAGVLGATADVSKKGHMRRYSFADGNNVQPTTNTVVPRATSESNLKDKSDTSSTKTKSTFSAISGIFGAQAIKRRISRHKKERLSNLSLNGQQEEVMTGPSSSSVMAEDNLVKKPSQPLAFQNEMAIMPIQTIRSGKDSTSTMGSSQSKLNHYSASLGHKKSWSNSAEQPHQFGSVGHGNVPLSGTVTKNALKNAEMIDVTPSHAFVKSVTAITIRGRRMGFSVNDVKSISLAGIECIDKIVEWSPTKIVVVIGPLDEDYEGSGSVSIVMETAGVIMAPQKFTWLSDPWNASELARKWSRLTDNEKKEQMHELVRGSHALRGEIKKLHRQLEDAAEEKDETHQYLERLLVKILNVAPSILEHDPDD